MLSRLSLSRIRVSLSLQEKIGRRQCLNLYADHRALCKTLVSERCPSIETDGTMHGHEMSMRPEIGQMRFSFSALTRRNPPNANRCLFEQQTGRANIKCGGAILLLIIWRNCVWVCTHARIRTRRTPKPTARGVRLTWLV